MVGQTLTGIRARDLTALLLACRTVAWIRSLALESAPRPWFVYLAPFAPHAPSVPAAWYNGTDDCKGVASPRIPSFNFTGPRKVSRGLQLEIPMDNPYCSCKLNVFGLLHQTSCSEYPPGTSRFQRAGPRQWWNGTDFPELTSCQPPITAADAVGIDAEARRRCQTLLSVDDTFTQVIAAVEELGQLSRTYVLVTSDHGAVPTPAFNVLPIQRCQFLCAACGLAWLSFLCAACAESESSRLGLAARSPLQGTIWATTC